MTLGAGARCGRRAVRLSEASMTNRLRTWRDRWLSIVMGLFFL